MDQVVNYFAMPGLKTIEVRADVISRKVLLAIVEVGRELYPDKNVSMASLLSRTRKKEHALLRHFYRYALKMFCPKMSLVEIVHYSGATNHSTAIHSIQAIKDFLDTQDEQTIRIKQSFENHTLWLQPLTQRLNTSLPK
jgi:chromosomal replication initiation ATPase DnaA